MVVIEYARPTGGCVVQDKADIWGDSVKGHQKNGVHLAGRGSAISSRHGVMHCGSAHTRVHGPSRRHG